MTASARPRQTITAPLRSVTSENSVRPRLIAGHLPRAPTDLAQRLHARKLLAFEPFEEGAARGRDVGEIVGHTGGVERSDRIAAPGDRGQFARFGQGRGGY